MRLIDYLDKGASLGAEAPFLSMGTRDFSYGDVQRLTYKIARALNRAGLRPGDKIAILSGNDPIAFACVFGLARAGLVWCPINPRNEAGENRHILDAFDCAAVIFQAAFAPMIDKIRPDLPKLRLSICLDATLPEAVCLDSFLDGEDDGVFDIAPVDDLVMIAGTGGTTGLPKGVMLSGRNLETMSAVTLASFPFVGRPVYLALAPLTHAAGVLSFPIMALGGRIVIMPKADLSAFLAVIESARVTHTFLPPTLIYMLLDHPGLPQADLSSLQCFWYGAAPIAPARLAEAIGKIGPIMAQFFGQTEAPMMITTMAAADHLNADGSIRRDRLSSAGHAPALVHITILDEHGGVRPTGEHGEIAVRSSLNMMGYYKDPDATAEAFRHGWLHTGDIGYLDADNYLYIVDRAKDMIITGGFNVYSIEVERALLDHPDVQDSAVVGLPDDKWGERIVAVLQLHHDRHATGAEIMAFVKERIGSIKTPKTIEIWQDLPRSKVGKVMKKDIRSRLLADQTRGTPP